MWDAEWDMIDDPMRMMSKFLPTWETSLHPLAELALLPRLGLASGASLNDYLLARLGVWTRDTSVIQDATSVQEVPFSLFNEHAMMALGALAMEEDEEG